jgi:hypothetical protein
VSRHARRETANGIDEVKLKAAMSDLPKEKHLCHVQPCSDLVYHPVGPPCVQPVPQPNQPADEGDFSITHTLLDQENFCTLPRHAFGSHAMLSFKKTRQWRAQIAVQSRLGDATATGKGDDLTWKESCQQRHSKVLSDPTYR